MSMMSFTMHTTHAHTYTSQTDIARHSNPPPFLRVLLLGSLFLNTFLLASASCLFHYYYVLFRPTYKLRVLLTSTTGLCCVLSTSMLFDIQNY